jgi:transcriptional regulator with XRE-family HTH domain
MTLRQLREEKGMTLDQVAAESGVPPQHLSKIETGRIVRPRKATQDAIALGLGVNKQEVYECFGEDR